MISDPLLLLGDHVVNVVAAKAAAEVEAEVPKEHVASQKENVAKGNKNCSNHTNQ